MDDRRKELIRQALDGELDEAARAELEAERAGAEFSAELEQAQAAKHALRELGASTALPGPALTDRIMDQIGENELRPWWAPLVQQLRMPAWAAAAAVVLVVGGLWGAAVIGAYWGAGAGSALPEARQPRAPVTLASVQPCEPQRELVYRFVVSAPEARQVAVVGDFNDWETTRTPMVDPDGDGQWSTTVVLRPGRYRYKFVVDGERWIVDPHAGAAHPDGFGGRNSLLTI